MVVIIILALIIIGLLVYRLFWGRQQKRDSDIELHTKNSKKRPISQKELGMCIQRGIFSKICCKNLISYWWHEMGYPCHKKYLKNQMNFIGNS